MGFEEVMPGMESTGSCPKQSAGKIPRRDKEQNMSARMLVRVGSFKAKSIVASGRMKENHLT
jgi:hypothetical protein